MRVGLARHFKIPYRKWEWIDSAGYAAFLRWYDAQEGEARASVTAGPWQECFSSDMPRAHVTAQRLASVSVTTLPLLREVPQAPLFTSRLRMPLVVWHVLSRIGWWFNHSSQSEGRRAAERRADEIVDWLRQQPADRRVLVVTHGFLLYVLRRKLERAGFDGHIPLHPRCGEVYLFSVPQPTTAAVTATQGMRGSQAAAR